MSSSAPASPPNDDAESMLTALSRARGISAENTAATRGSSTIWFASDMAIVNVRVVSVGSNAPPRTASCNSRKLRASTGANSSARGVGTIPRPFLVTSRSPMRSLRRASALLTADGVTCSRAAARATLPSVRTASRTCSRWRSIRAELTDVELTAVHLSLAITK